MVSNCDFGLELHAFLEQYCYFYNDFTIKASLLNLIQSAIATFISLSSYVLYLYAFALPKRRVLPGNFLQTNPHNREFVCLLTILQI
jgi:hypothetical protein